MDPDAPMPHVLCNGRRAFVLTYLRSGTEVSDGTTVLVVDPRSDLEPIGLIEFNGVYNLLFGGLNDEALDGHPLSGRGLRSYAFHEVQRSAWIADSERSNSVHPAHRGGWHDQLHHYVLTFHDETLECLAEAIRSEVLFVDMPQALTLAVARLNAE